MRTARCASHHDLRGSLLGCSSMTGDGSDIAPLIGSDDENSAPSGQRYLKTIICASVM